MTNSHQDHPASAPAASNRTRSYFVSAQAAPMQIRWGSEYQLTGFLESGPSGEIRSYLSLPDIQFAWRQSGWAKYLPSGFRPLLRRFALWLLRLALRLSPTLEFSKISSP